MPSKGNSSKAASADSSPSPAKEKSPSKKKAAAKDDAAPVKAAVSKAASAAAATTPVAAATAASAAALLSDEPAEGEIKPSVFLKISKQKLLDLKDSLMDSMTGMANETLRSKAEGSEASAFGMHQADAGTDAYDRDFALSLLSQEQDALYEIEEALKRVEAGTYGICEMSGKRIPQARLEALPFARFTIECQQQYEKEVPNNSRRQVRSLFGLMGSEDEDEEGDEESVESEKE
ncbi:MAG: yocK [Verrucomicrobiales bacterium]|nr:yocK [Verrucomicrobiales bacterium]